MQRKWILSLAVAFIGVGIAAGEAQAICNNGGTLQYACMSWQQDCAPTWIHSCYCCV